MAIKHSRLGISSWLVDGVVANPSTVHNFQIAVQTTPVTSHPSHAYDSVALYSSHIFESVADGISPRCESTIELAFGLFWERVHLATLLITLVVVSRVYAQVCK